MSSFTFYVLSLRNGGSCTFCLLKLKFYVRTTGNVKISCLIVFFLLQSSEILILRTTGRSVVTLCGRLTATCTVTRVGTSPSLKRLRLMHARSGQMGLLEPLPTGVRCASLLHRTRGSYGSCHRLVPGLTRGQ